MVEAGQSWDAGFSDIGFATAASPRGGDSSLFAGPVGTPVRKCHVEATRNTEETHDCDGPRKSELRDKNTPDPTDPA